MSITKIMFLLVGVFLLEDVHALETELRISVSESKKNGALDIKDVPCVVYVGEQVQNILAPGSFKVNPRKGDILRVNCNKDGYVTVDIINGLQKPVSARWYSLREARSNASGTIVLGLGFVGLPIALLTKSWIPVEAVFVAGAVSYAYSWRRSSVYPRGYYTYDQRYVFVGVLKPEELGERKAFVFDKNAIPNDN